MTGQRRSPQTKPQNQDLKIRTSDQKALITLLHLQGHWSDEAPLQTFSNDSGEHINVWPATSELQGEGPPPGQPQPRGTAQACHRRPSVPQAGPA